MGYGGELGFRARAGGGRSLRVLATGQNSLLRVKEVVWLEDISLPLMPSAWSVRRAKYS